MWTYPQVTFHCESVGNYGWTPAGQRTNESVIIIHLYSIMRQGDVNWMQHFSMSWVCTGWTCPKHPSSAYHYRTPFGGSKFCLLYPASRYFRPSPESSPHGPAGSHSAISAQQTNAASTALQMLHHSVSRSVSPLSSDGFGLVCARERSENHTFWKRAPEWSDFKTLQFPCKRAKTALYENGGTCALWSQLLYPQHQLVARQYELHFPASCISM